MFLISCFLSPALQAPTLHTCTLRMSRPRMLMVRMLMPDLLMVSLVLQLGMVLLCEPMLRIIMPRMFLFRMLRPRYVVPLLVGFRPDSQNKQSRKVKIVVGTGLASLCRVSARDTKGFGIFLALVC